jgi:hypothetical protein
MIATRGSVPFKESEAMDVKGIPTTRLEGATEVGVSTEAKQDDRP